MNIVGVGGVCACCWFIVAALPADVTCVFAWCDFGGLRVLLCALEVWSGDLRVASCA